VKVFFAASAVAPPELPANFWANFPNNVLPANSPWQPIASHQVIATLEAGKAEIVPFEWAVPATASSATSLLAIISADNDAISTTELNVSSLVQNNKKTGLKNLTVVNPPPSVGPTIHAMHLELWGSRQSKTFALEFDRGASAVVRAVVLSKELSKAARGAKLATVRLNADDRAELERLIAATPALKGKLDLKSAYALQKGSWLESIKLSAKKPEAVVVLINPKATDSQGSIIQRAADGTVVGGFTFKSVKPTNW